jgi:hypothetical protein
MHVSELSLAQNGGVQAYRCGHSGAKGGENGITVAWVLGRCGNTGPSEAMSNASRSARDTL